MNTSLTYTLASYVVICAYRWHLSEKNINRYIPRT
jgi:hypothetical protein